MRSLASAPRTPNRQAGSDTLVHEMSVQSECPASNYTAEQEVDADVPSPTTQASTYSEPAEAVGDVSADTSDDITGYVAGATAAAIMWCVLGGCASDDSSSVNEHRHRHRMTTVRRRIRITTRISSTWMNNTPRAFGRIRTSAIVEC
jgi:hypothetical protein